MMNTGSFVDNTTKSGQFTIIYHQTSWHETEWEYHGDILTISLFHIPSPHEEIQYFGCLGSSGTNGSSECEHPPESGVVVGDLYTMGVWSLPSCATYVLFPSAKKKRFWWDQ
jgi:hypothetical protein